MTKKNNILKQTQRKFTQYCRQLYQHITWRLYHNFTRLIQYNYKASVYGNICLERLSLPPISFCYLEKNNVFHFHNKIIVEFTLFIWIFRKEWHISSMKTTFNVSLWHLSHDIFTTRHVPMGLLGGGGGGVKHPVWLRKKRDASSVIMVICFKKKNLCLLVCQRSRSCLNRPTPLYPIY